MADQIVTNEVPAVAAPFYTAVRLVETLIAAGWTLVENSDGTTVSTGTNYWTGANYASLGADAWIIIEANSGQQILFRRGSSSSTTEGWIVWSKGGGFTTGGGASAPANIPADAAEVRGTFTAGTPGSFGTDASWFGSSNNMVRLNIGARDASGSGDESWWIVTRGSGLSYTSTGNGDHGRLAFEKLVQPSGLGISDAAPYAWWCPMSATGNWHEGLDDCRVLLYEDNSSNSYGCWRRWWNAGQAGEAFKLYGSGNFYAAEGSASDAVHGENASWEQAGDQVIYQATPQQLIHRIHLSRTLESGYKDPHGGFTSNIFFTQENDVPNLSTLLNGAYAKFGNWLTVWWDGNPLNPPVE